MARGIGKMRNDQNNSLGRKHRYNLGSNQAQDEAIHVTGAASEIAVAKALNRYWSNPFSDAPELSKTAADVGERIQVRGTKYQNGSLLLHPQDVDDHWFVLVVGELPNLNVVGGILGKDGKQQRWWQERVKGRPCYFVPQHALVSTEDLRLICY
jgi:hypothetical protein